MVSIDPTPSTFETGFQDVNFRGGIDDTQFGKDFLESDIILKKYSLELVSPVEAVPPYKMQCLNGIEEQINTEGAKVVRVRWLPPDSSQSLFGQIKQAEEILQTRFWFYPKEPTRLVAREGVFCIKELGLKVMVELAYANKEGYSQTNQPNYLESSGDAFASEFTEHFQIVASSYPLLKRLKVLFDLIAIAEGIKNLQDKPDLKYFLQEHNVSRVQIPKQYELISLFALVERSDGLKQAIQISGGIKFKTELKLLNYGDVTPLRDIVIKSRPRPNALTWSLPLETWEMPNSNDLESEALDYESSKQQLIIDEKDLGFSLNIQNVVLSENDKKYVDQPNKFFGFLPPPPTYVTNPPSIQYIEKLSGVDIAPEPKGKPANLKELKERILKSRPSADSLTYPIKIPKQD